MRALLACGITAVLALVSSAEAQFSADVKISGDAFRHGRAQTYQRHAQEQSQMLYYYSQPQQPKQSRQPIPKEEAKELVAGIRRNLTASDKALAELKEAHVKEPEVVKLIDSIQKHHAKAHEVCGMAEKECAKEHGDHAVIGDCCGQMWHELDAAKADMEKLGKLLKVEKLPTPPKADTTKKEDKK
ncbi:MAG: hypothetical protein ACT4QC_09435 [Planctomycetaceae bacterium]